MAQKCFVGFSQFAPTGSGSNVSYDILIVDSDNPGLDEVSTIQVPLSYGDDSLTLTLKLEVAILETYGIDSAATIIL